MLNAKNCVVAIGETDMDYISFGSGKRPLVMLPGLGDALKTVKGTALSFALMYKAYAKDYTVYVFSRKNALPAGYSIRDMAEDQARAMERLGIKDAFLMGVSQGGMIAMHLAAAHPELVARLVLANTAAKCNDVMGRVVGNWLTLAEAEDFKALFIDTAEMTYTEKKLKQYRPLYSVLSAAAKPKSLERFKIQASACLAHDASGALEKIKCPTLVIGGDGDKIMGPEAASELASAIADCTLTLCVGYGHGAYEECPSFNARVLDFFGAESQTLI